MKIITEEIFDEERAFYGCRDTLVKGCLFDGPADGESAFKECRNITVEDTLLKVNFGYSLHSRFSHSGGQAVFSYIRATSDTYILAKATCLVIGMYGAIKNEMGMITRKGALFTATDKD